MQKGSEKDMARRNNISTNSVNHILDDISHDKYVKNNGILPTSFAIDEFDATKDTKSKMAFIIVNQDKRIFEDILRLKEIMLNILLWIYINLITYS